MEHIIFFALNLVFSIVYALFEIQIEGGNGWAQNLPTWRKKLKFLIYDRDFTGFHLYGSLIILILLHFVFVFQPWTLNVELKILAFYLISQCLEDFLWFVLNPAFGLKNFNAKAIPWHKRWFLGLPADYWIIIPLGILLYFLAL